MENRTPKILKALFGDDLGFNNGLHWTTIISEKVLLAIIGALTMVAAVIDLKAVWISQSVSLSDLFLFFIYAEIVGMVGAFYASRRIPVTLPIIIAITASSSRTIGKRIGPTDRHVDAPDNMRLAANKPTALKSEETTAGLAV